MKNIYRVESHQSQAGTLPTVEHTISMLYHKDIFSTQGVVQKEMIKKKKQHTIIHTKHSFPGTFHTNNFSKATERTDVKYQL